MSRRLSPGPRRCSHGRDPSGGITLARLADECGVSHAEAFRQVQRIPELRHWPHKEPLRGHDIQRLRPLLIAARPAPVAPMVLAQIPRPEAPAKEERPMDKPVDGMTIRQIAEFCEVGETTVRRWIDIASATMAELGAKMAEAAETKKPALFTRAEVLAILRAGGKGLLADLLEHNGQPPVPPPVKSARLPAGIQLRELRMIYGAAEAGKRLDVLLGYARPAPRIEAPAAPGEACLGFAALEAIAAGLPSDIVAKAARAGAAATEAVIRRELARASVDAKQERLAL